jgi:hypothetical protein
MYRADTFSISDGVFRPFGPEATAPDYHQRVELAPMTLESLVTWDVSGHAQCEKDRLYSVCRGRRAMRAGY